MTHAKMPNASFSMRFKPSRASLFRTSLRSSSSTFGMSILTGHASPHAPHRLEANGSPGSWVTPMNWGVMIAPRGREYTHGKLCPPILRYTGQVFKQAPQRMQYSRSEEHTSELQSPM